MTREFDSAQARLSVLEERLFGRRVSQDVRDMHERLRLAPDILRQVIYQQVSERQQDVILQLANDIEMFLAPDEQTPSEVQARLPSSVNTGAFTVHSETVNCLSCNGVGSTMTTYRTPHASPLPVKTTCVTCGGTGRVEKVRQYPSSSFRS